MSVASSSAPTEVRGCRVHASSDGVGAGAETLVVSSIGRGFA